MADSKPIPLEFEKPLEVLSEQITRLEQQLVSHPELETDIEKLQELAKEMDARVSVLAMPGKFVGPGSLLARVAPQNQDSESRVDLDRVASAFRIGRTRTFDEDPSFGVIALSEIASRALSPAVNDPGTAIDIVRTLVRVVAGFLEQAYPSETG